MRQEGKYLGIGVVTYVEICGMAPSQVLGAVGAGAGGWESATVRVHPTGKVTLYSGASSHGQGHETAFAQIVGDGLGIPFEDVEVVHGDTAQVQFGIGTFGSRSAAVGGMAAVMSVNKIEEKAKKIAASYSKPRRRTWSSKAANSSSRARRGGASPSSRWPLPPMCRINTPPARAWFGGDELL